MATPPSTRRPRPEEPDLRDLPRGPRTTRLVTLLVLALTAVVSGALALSLWPEARYALVGGSPQDVGSLAGLSLDADEGLSSRWIRGAGGVTDRAVRYRRPLDGDRYRLAQVEGNDRLWVQMRIPEDMAEEHFIPPASFVGRLLSLEEAGLRYGRLEDALSQVGADPGRVWLLIDGEAPGTTRWSLALLGLFTGFMGFCAFGLVRLTRPVRDRVS